jgi:hypothetical protein
MRMKVALGLVGAAAASLIALGQPQRAHAQFSDDQQQIAQCVLNYTGTTRSSLAVVKIKNACNQLHQSNSLASDRERNYDQCLLSHISGAQSDYAAVQISSACHNADSSF